MPEQFTKAEFAQKIKAQYPVYADIPDDELADKMLAKYPEYQKLLKPETAAPPKAPGSGLGVMESAMNTAVDWLPTIGGAVGGIAGGIGGTVAGFGVGGVPGAIGGAALGGAAGEGFRETIQSLRGKEAPRAPMQAVKDMAVAGGTQAALEAGGQVAGRVIGKVGTAVYRSYLKPSLAASNIHEAEELVNTAIKEGLPVTHGGVEKGRRIIGELTGQVKGILARTKGEIDLGDVADQVRQWATKNYYKPGVPSADFDAAMAVANNIDRHASQAVPSFIKPSSPTAGAVKANEIKQGLQAAGADASLMDRAATKQASEAGGHFMKVALEDLAPGIAPLNARESKLIPAAEAINRAVQREANQYVAHGTKMMVGGLVGSEEYSRTKDPWSSAAKGLATTLALQPAVATRLAIVAARLGKMSGDIPANVARVALAAVLNGQDEGSQ